MRQEKIAQEEKRDGDKRACKDLNEKFRKQHLTHDLEAGRRRVNDEAEHISEDDENLDEEEGGVMLVKRKRAAKPGTVHDSAEFAEYKAILREKADIREEERKDRRMRDMRAAEEVSTFNRRAEERQLKSLEMLDLYRYSRLWDRSSDHLSYLTCCSPPSGLVDRVATVGSAPDACHSPNYNKWFAALLGGPVS